MKIIVGLGNIGKEYENTYHNVGFMVVDGCLKQLNLSKSKDICNGKVYETNIAGEKIYFVKPTTFMNNSGICVKSLLAKFKAEITDCLVIVDDIDLPAGAVRIRKSGSAGTHNGLRSIVANCSTDFLRVRVGTGKPMPNQTLVDFVLSKAPLNGTDFANGIEKATQAVLEYAQGYSIDSVMQKYNG